jgi:hypothetical protein
MGRKADTLFLSESEDAKDEKSCIWFYEVYRDKFTFTYLFLETRSEIADLIEQAQNRAR